MYRKQKSGWLKHLDFSLLDLGCLLLTLIISYIARNGYNAGFRSLYLDTAIMMAILDVVVVFFMESYKGILRRGYWKELMATIKHCTIVLGATVFYLFLTKHGQDYSRAVILIHWISAVIYMYLVRITWKKHLLNQCASKAGKRAMLLVCLREEARTVIDTIRANDVNAVKLTGLILIDNTDGVESIDGIPVIASKKEEALDYIRTNWVDEVFVKYPRENDAMNVFLEICKKMGVTVHYSIERFLDEESQVIEKIGGYTVLSSSVKLATTRQLFLKRALDILGGIVGVLFTGILTIFVAPIILIQSPGPIFFKQERVGKNGKHFYLYKFRSMYMDAEARKAELMALNEVESGLMFKMEHDPRIIGGDKGIGSFIRKTSIDEFQQFWNVLKGEMSLVGTRPPTVDEWKQYEFHHRKRLATKPGITGMWQVSGRSQIKDFEEVVRLDIEYINDWNLGKDIKILFKTVGVVLKKEGSV